MGKINGLNKFRTPLAYLPGLLLLSLGIYLVIDRPQVAFIMNLMHENLKLREETDNYVLWQRLKVFFRVYLFEVTNPQAVMAGDNPQLREVGPFVYEIPADFQQAPMSGRLVIEQPAVPTWFFLWFPYRPWPEKEFLFNEKHINGVDEALDEINFTMTKTYYFNEKESGDLTEDTSVTILNFAYLGTIEKIISLAPAFLKKIGPIIHQIFPGTVNIFQTGKAGDIIFSGLPLDCVNVDKALNMICNVLKGNPPPLLKRTDTPGHFLYSLFYRINGTHQGPFTVNRGVKNIYSLGNMTSFKNMRVTNFWNTEACNTVSGGDSIINPPQTEKFQHIEFYEPELCRSLYPSFTKEVVVNTLNGYQYEANDIGNDDCYCPMNKKKELECLPSGLLDITKCQDVPVIYSQPHFLHASAELLDYAQGLHPDPKKHTTFIVIEPLTGAPLSGSKKIQLNMKVSSVSTVPWLINVTDGYFPLLWAEESSVSTMEQMEVVINSHRLLNIASSLSWLPLFMGIWLLIRVWLIGNQAYYQITYPRYRPGAAFQ